MNNNNDNNKDRSGGGGSTNDDRVTADVGRVNSGDIGVEEEQENLF